MKMTFAEKQNQVLNKYSIHLEQMNNLTLLQKAICKAIKDNYKELSRKKIKTSNDREILVNDVLIQGIESKIKWDTTEFDNFLMKSKLPPSIIISAIYNYHLEFYRSDDNLYPVSKILYISNDMIANWMNNIPNFNLEDMWLLAHGYVSSTAFLKDFASKINQLADNSERKVIWPDYCLRFLEVNVRKEKVPVHQ